MAIISILNPKGGSGKTTLATNLTRAFIDLGKTSLLIDSDPQGSARDWQAANEENPVPVIGLDRAANLRNVPTVTNGYDLTLIDGAGRLEDIVAAAIRISDLVLIPVQPSPYDLWAAGDLVDLIKTRQTVADKPLAAFVITRAIKHTTLGREVTQALEEFDLPVLKGRTIQRQVYARSASEGLTPIDLEPEGDAAFEVRQMAKEVLGFMGNDQ